MSQIQRDANQMAEERTDMALDRTVFALERTLMAWIRTAIAMISFGFTMFKFLQAFESTAPGKMLHQEAPRRLGLALILLAIGLLFMGIVQYLHTIKPMKKKRKEKLPVSLALIGAVCVMLIGVFAILNMYTGFGGL